MKHSALRSSLFTGILSTGFIGFCWGTLISTASLSQIWPVDALIFAGIFGLAGVFIGVIGWYRAKNQFAIALIAIISTILGTYVLVFLLPSLFDGFLNIFNLETWQSQFSFMVSWLVVCSFIAWILFLNKLGVRKRETVIADESLSSVDRRNS